MKKTGIQRIADERAEQIEKHGRTHEHDRKVNHNEQLALGALMLLEAEYSEGVDPESYPFGWDAEICRKMLSKPYEDRLVIAGALIAAELDRLASIEEMYVTYDENTDPNQFGLEIKGVYLDEAIDLEFKKEFMEWDNSFGCLVCKNTGRENFTYLRHSEAGEHYRCDNCSNTLITGFEPQSPE